MLNNIENNKLYKISNKRKLAAIFGIPNYINLKRIDDDIVDCYKYFYIKKDITKYKDLSEDERHKAYINSQKCTEYIDTKPNDYSKSRYRELICIKSSWYKKCLKRINNELSSLLYYKCNGKYVCSFDYLYSGVKGRSSVKNAKFHSKSKHVFKIDIANFFPSIDNKRVYNFFYYTMKQPNDVAKMCSYLCTLPNNNGEQKRTLSQGLPTSTVLSFLVNLDLFESLKKLCDEYEYKMTVFVDDVTFSSNEELDIKFKNKLFSLFKKFNYNIREKATEYGKYTKKVITGVCIDRSGNLLVDKYKYDEIITQYQYLKDVLDEDTIIKNSNEVKLFNKFCGNVSYYKEVEGYTNKEFDSFIKSVKDMMKSINRDV